MEAALNAPTVKTRRVSPALAVVLVIVALAIAWQLAKLIFNFDNRTLPNLWDIAGAFFSHRAAMARFSANSC